MLLTRQSKQFAKPFYSTLPAKSEKKTSHFSRFSRSDKANEKLRTKYLSIDPLPTEIDLKVSHVMMPFDQDNHLLLLNLVTDELIVKPSTFVCVLDVSGSMNSSLSLANDPESSMFSRLDLVKHSVNIIIHCLQPEDSLSLIVFDNNARTILDTTKMDTNGKKAAQKVLYQIVPSGKANLWDGLNQSLDVLNKLNNPAKNKFIVLLTDGEPNCNPQKGILNAFINRLDGQMRGNLHTIGYGYDLDSKLLLDLARCGDGAFMHVPDYSMCNKVFINLLSNCLTTSVQNVRATIQNHNSIIPKWLNSLSRYDSGLSQFQMNIGPIKCGQPRRIPILIPNSDINLDIRIDLEYDGKHQEYIAPGTNLNPITDSIFFNGIIKANMLPIIQRELESVDPSHQKICVELQQLYYRVERVKQHLAYIDPQLDAWLKKIQSSDVQLEQLIKALENPKYFNECGIHYLNYFMRSHELDTSLQSYGNKLFRDIRSEIEEIIADIPIPQPTLPKVVSDLSSKP